MECQRCNAKTATHTLTIRTDAPREVQTQQVSYVCTSCVRTMNLGIYVATPIIKKGK